MRGGDRSMLVVLVRVPTRAPSLGRREAASPFSSRGVGPRASVPLEVRSSARPTGRGAPNAPMKTTPLSSTANCRSMPWYARNERVAASMAAWTGATSPCNNAGSRPATSTKTVTTSRNAPSKPGAPLSRSARAASGANARSGLAIGLASAAYADLASLAAATASASSGAGPPISAGSSCHAALLTRSPPCARACEDQTFKRPRPFSMIFVALDCSGVVLLEGYCTARTGGQDVHSRSRGRVRVVREGRAVGRDLRWQSLCGLRRSWIRCHRGRFYTGTLKKTRDDFRTPAARVDAAALGLRHHAAA